MRNTPLFLLLILFIGCQSHYYSEVENLDGDWQKHEKIEFKVNIEDTNKTYDIFIILRNNLNYPFSNLFLFTKLDKLDTLEYQIADQKGNWLGTGVGNTKELKLLLKENYRFHKKGQHSISLQHGMRKDTLLGIENIGLVLDQK